MRPFFFFVLLLCFKCSEAQFNDSVKNHIKIAPTGVINKTNAGSSYILSNALGYNIKGKNIALNTSANWTYGASDHQLSNNDLSIHADLNFFKVNSKLYYWTLINFDKAFSLKINYRLQTGAGISYDFIDSPKLRINVSDGLLYEKGDLVDADGTVKTYDIPRNSLRLLYRWKINNRAAITGIHFYQPSLFSIKDYIIQSGSTASFLLFGGLSFTTSIVFNKVSATGRENLLVTYGLNFEKYF